MQEPGDPKIRPLNGSEVRCRVRARKRRLIPRHPERVRITPGTLAENRLAARLSSPPARRWPISHREKPRGAGGLASVLAMGIVRGMVRSRDLVPRRRVLCSASAACNSNVERTSAMVVRCSAASSGCSRTWRSAMLLQPLQGVPHALLSMCCLAHALRMNARSKGCHVGHICMMQRALESTCVWVRTRYV